MPEEYQHEICTSIHSNENTPFFSFREFLKYVGPGLLMSIAYIDPGNLEAAIISGSTAGYAHIWVLFLSVALGLVIQSRTLKLALVTGKHLAEHCRHHFDRKRRLVIWINVEAAIIGSDIQEVLGSAIALRILSSGHLPLWSGTLLSVAGTMFFLLLEQIGFRFLEAFFGILISVMSISFGIQYFLRLPPQIDVLKGMFIPTIPSGTSLHALGIIGATIMPHNLFLHSALVLTRDVDQSDDAALKKAVRYNNLESAIVLVITFCINMFVLATFANLDYLRCNISQKDVGLVNGGECLSLNYGKWALYIWAIGLFASGQSSTCTGTYAGQFVMQGFLKWNIPGWKRAILTRAVAILPAFLIAMTLKESKLDEAQKWLNVIQAFHLPFALIPVIQFTSSSNVMGLHWVDSKFMTAFLWILSLVVVGANLYISFLQVILITAHRRILFFLGISLGGYLTIVLLLIFFRRTRDDHSNSAEAELTSLDILEK